MDISPLASISPALLARHDSADYGAKFAQSMLFETFLKSAGIREALVPASLEGGIFGDFMIQQLAQDLAQQMGGAVSSHPYRK